MATSSGQLSGAADYRIVIDVWYSGVQDWGANTSRFDWRVELHKGSGASAYIGTAMSWSANIGGVGYSGSFTMTQAQRYEMVRTVGSGSTWHGHDANGYRGGFASSAYFNGNVHSNVGSGGSGDAWVDAPRIPKPPLAAGAPTYSNILPTTATVSWTGTSDDRGAGIDQYLLRVHTNSNVESAGYTDYPLSGSTFSRVLTGLTPGRDYWAAVYAHNSQGYSPKSGTTTFRTLSGMYRWDGGSWRPAEIQAYQDGTYKTGLVQVWNGTAWVLAS